MLHGYCHRHCLRERYEKRDALFVDRPSSHNHHKCFFQCVCVCTFSMPKIVLLARIRMPFPLTCPKCPVTKLDGKVRRSTNPTLNKTLYPIPHDVSRQSTAHSPNRMNPRRVSAFPLLNPSSFTASVIKLACQD